jgi:glycosyltransferase involved in cell wall biosynthesis
MCGGPQDIITETSGVLVPVDDVEAMAQAMLAMLDKAGAYDREAIRAGIIERFGRDTVCDALGKACADAVAIKNGVSV